MKFFFDNCISHHLAALMHALNQPVHEVEHLTQRFDRPNVPDVEWLQAIASENIIVVSADPAIPRSRTEREVWQTTGLTSFFFGGGFTELSKWPQIEEVARWWPRVLITAKKAAKGDGYLLPLRGKQEPRLIYPLDRPSKK